MQFEKVALKLCYERNGVFAGLIINLNPRHISNEKWSSGSLLPSTNDGSTSWDQVGTIWAMCVCVGGGGCKNVTLNSKKLYTALWFSLANLWNNALYISSKSRIYEAGNILKGNFFKFLCDLEKIKNKHNSSQF